MIHHPTTGGVVIEPQIELKYAPPTTTGGGDLSHKSTLTPYPSPCGYPHFVEKSCVEQSCVELWSKAVEQAVRSRAVWSGAVWSRAVWSCAAKLCAAGLCGARL